MHTLQVIRVDKGKLDLEDIFNKTREFNSAEECQNFLQRQLVSNLHERGYLAASLDSVAYDRDITRAWVYGGEKYTWGEIRFDSAILQEQPGDMTKNLFSFGRTLNPNELFAVQQKILHYYENHGYPFAKVKLDSSFFIDAALHAIMKVYEGPLYHIDSIVVAGKVHIQTSFLEQYLGIPSGSIYKADVLESISKKIADLGFFREVKPWDLTLLGTGAKLNLYLESKQSSQINLLVGLMPANAQLGGKLLLTGEANMELKNTFGGGESTMLNWQQIQVQSPRLLIAFQKPYLFKSNTGVDFQFNLFKKDSSFLTLNTKLGMQYLLNAKQLVKVFFKQFSSSLLDVDTNAIKISKRLPSYLDIRTSNIGIELQYRGTDNRYNPRAGIEFSSSFEGGMRKIQPNMTITTMAKDRFDYSTLYDTIKLTSSQFKGLVKGDVFTKLGRQSTLKLGLQGGYIYSDKIFTNELFQLGGIKSLRGFDEESIYASRFLIATLEYRFLIGPSSYLFSFIDAAQTARKTYRAAYNGKYIGAGLGISFETKSGIFSLGYAVGKQPETGIDIKQAKIHFGFVSLF